MPKCPAQPDKGGTSRQLLPGSPARRDFNARRLQIKGRHLRAIRRHHYTHADTAVIRTQTYEGLVVDQRFEGSILTATLPAVSSED